jgi:hypothetical protein
LKNKRLVEATDFRLGQAGDQLAVAFGQGRSFDPPYLALVDDQDVTAVGNPVDFSNAGTGGIEQPVVTLYFGSGCGNGEGQRGSREDQGG